MFAFIWSALCSREQAELRRAYGKMTTIIKYLEGTQAFIEDLEGTQAELLGAYEKHAEYEVSLVSLYSA